MNKPQDDFYELTEKGLELFEQVQRNQNLEELDKAFYEVFEKGYPEKEYPQHLL